VADADQAAERVGRPAGGGGPAHPPTIERRCCGGVLLRRGGAPEEHGPTPPDMSLSHSPVGMLAKSTRSRFLAGRGRTSLSLSLS
jgi:hypothetical protein